MKSNQGNWFFFGIQPHSHSTYQLNLGLLSVYLVVVNKGVYSKMKAFGFCSFFCILNNTFYIFQDETSSQTSSKESKEENLTFQVAYEMNHVDNETIKYPCNM